MSREAPPAPHLQGEVTVNKSRFCFPLNSVATSAGVFTGDDPLKFYFPLLLYHVCAVFALSRGVHALLSHANVPLVISQIMAAVLLGPSLLGQVLPHASELFATPEGWVQLNTVGTYSFVL
ncbi:cation/H(+) antiporter 16-like [Miscanthus floridulus]|uniref:cation/H(+) antiporter 16-like n=1 Tax=Miscanthus floridulus TaxID=154761 RepID=UPI003457EBD8